MGAGSFEGIFSRNQNTKYMNSKYWISVAMRTHGGSFVQILGELILKSDPDNYQRLCSAFPDYFERYGKIAEQLKQEDDAKP